MAKKKRTIYVLFFIGFISLAFWLSRIAGENEFVKNMISNYGYAGAFVVAAISGFNLAVPVPAIAFLPALVEAGLNFWLVILIVTLGMSTGDSIGFFIGKTGRHIAKPATIVRLMNELEHLKNKYKIKPMLVVFAFASVAPLPNEILVIPLSFMGYKFEKMMPFVFGGNLIFNTLSAFGIINLFKLF